MTEKYILELELEGDNGPQTCRCWIPEEGDPSSTAKKLGAKYHIIDQEDMQLLEEHIRATQDILREERRSQSFLGEPVQAHGRADHPNPSPEQMDIKERKELKEPVGLGVMPPAWGEPRSVGTAGRGGEAAPRGSVTALLHDVEAMMHTHRTQDTQPQHPHTQGHGRAPSTGRGGAEPPPDGRAGAVPGPTTMLLHEVDALILDPPPHTPQDDGTCGASDRSGEEGEGAFGKDLQAMVRGLEDMLLQLSPAHTRGSARPMEAPASASSRSSSSFPHPPSRTPPRPPFPPSPQVDAAYPGHVAAPFTARYTASKHEKRVSSSSVVQQPVQVPSPYSSSLFEGGGGLVGGDGWAVEDLVFMRNVRDERRTHTRRRPPPPRPASPPEGPRAGEVGGELWRRTGGERPRSQVIAGKDVGAKPMATSARRREDEAVAMELGLDPDWLATQEHQTQSSTRTGEADTRPWSASCSLQSSLSRMAHLKRGITAQGCSTAAILEALNGLRAHSPPHPQASSTREALAWSASAPRKAGGPSHCLPEELIDPCLLSTLSGRGGGTEVDSRPRRQNGTTSKELQDSVAVALNQLEDLIGRTTRSD